MRILLTGATGFIGSAFARLALANGHAIGGLILPVESIPPALEDTEVTWLRGALDAPPWREIEAFKPEACLHTAWITTPGVYLESPENFRFLEHSVSFLRGVVERGVRHIIGLGTCIEYQITDGPLSEDTTPIAPSATYARCKNELRLALQRHAEERGYKCCWARIFYPYGPGEHPSRLCSSIIDKLNLDEPVVLKTPESTKDYIYITDVASALLTILRKQFDGTINVGTGIGTSVRQIARTLGALLNKPHLIQESSSTPDPFRFVVANAARLRNLGWQPTHDLAAGLEGLIKSKQS